MTAETDRYLMLRLEVTCREDGSLQLRRLQLEPVTRRWFAALWAGGWGVIFLMALAGVCGWFPPSWESSGSGPGTWLALALSGYLTYASLTYLVWATFGRESWQVTRNCLEIEQKIGRFRRRLRYQNISFRLQDQPLDDNPIRRSRTLYVGQGLKLRRLLRIIVDQDTPLDGVFQAFLTELTTRTGWIVVPF